MQQALMGSRKGGARRKSRRTMSKHARKKGKVKLSSHFAGFNEGDRVLLSTEPAVQRGMYHLRFHGKTGKVLSKKGKCYEVQIQDGKNKKTLIVHPVHLKRK